MNKIVYKFEMHFAQSCSIVIFDLFWILMQMLLLLLNSFNLQFAYVGIYLSVQSRLAILEAYSHRTIVIGHCKNCEPKEQLINIGEKFIVFE